MYAPKTILTPQHAALEEHNALRDLLGKIGEAITDPRCGHGQWKHRMGLLRARLIEHFEHEEEGGYFRELVTSAPWLAKQAAVLEQEHVLLRTRIDDLVSSRYNDHSRADLQDRFQNFCEALLAHEVRENNLIQKSQCDDLGSAD